MREQITYKVEHEGKTYEVYSEFMLDMREYSGNPLAKRLVDKWQSYSLPEKSQVEHVYHKAKNLGLRGLGNISCAELAFVMCEHYRKDKKRGQNAGLSYAKFN